MAELIIKGLFETLAMIVFSTILAYVFGLPLGIWAHITKPNGLKPNKVINKILDLVINIGRSIPVIILMLYLSKFTTFLVGTMIGVRASIVSLVIAAIPFVARMVENSLEEIDYGVIEIAKTLGASDLQIITKVMIRESIPSIIRGASITCITLVGYSAMAGAIGGGGLGAIAINYGLYKFDFKVMSIVLVVIILLVQVLQILFNFVVEKIE